MNKRIKRIALLLMSLPLLTGVVACAQEIPASSGGEGSASAEPTGGKTLVVYFSRTGEQYQVGNIEEGNTAKVAKVIAEKTGADLFEIVPEKDYPYTYNELLDVSQEEQNNDARPAYQGEVSDLAQYDTIFVGAPVWWGDWPMIMYTFFENNDLSGKTLAPFSTHEGSGLSGFDSKLASACPDATVTEGMAITGSTAQNDAQGTEEEVAAWLSKLGL